MNTVRTGLLCCLALLLASCSKLDKVTTKTLDVVKPGLVNKLAKTATKAVVKAAGLEDTVLGQNIEDAVIDIDVEGLGRAQACELYVKKGRMLAESAFEHEWSHFAPLWETARDPATDLAYCRQLITDAGATIVTKKSDSGAASAVCFQAQFPMDFDSKPLGEQAAIACHEAGHLKEQQRMGCKTWLRTYAKVSGRLYMEGEFYVLMWALLERYGWSKEQAEAHIRRRAERFPETYAIPRAVISDSCTFNLWSSLRKTFRERTGH